MTDLHEHAFETSAQAEEMIERFEKSLARMRAELDISHRLVRDIAKLLNVARGGK